MLQMSFSVPVLNLDAPADEQTHARVYAKVCRGEEAGGSRDMDRVTWTVSCVCKSWAAAWLKLC